MTNDNLKVGWITASVAIASALGGVATLVTSSIYIVSRAEGVGGWQELGMLAVAVVISFAVAAMLRFALAPMISSKPAQTVDVDVAIRSRIAPLVLTVGSIAIVALAMTLIISFALLAYFPSAAQGVIANKVDTMLTGVFSAVLPVVATWVGTVLAFYFGSENFRQAVQTTREVLGERAETKKITDVMIPYDRIARLDADSEDEALNIKILDVIDTMSEAARRVIVFNAKTRTPMYIIRSAVPPMPEAWITPDYGRGPGLTNNTNVKDYLAQNDGNNKLDAQRFRFIDVDATPEAALALMKKEGVDDLFITKGGQATSRVLGWVSKNDLYNK